MLTSTPPPARARSQQTEGDGMRQLLENKVAIVTGGASGLGRATAEIFATEGARVVIADVNDERGAETCKAVEALGGEALYIHTDVRSSQDVAAAVELA